MIDNHLYDIDVVITPTGFVGRNCKASHRDARSVKAKAKG